MGRIVDSGRPADLLAHSTQFRTMLQGQVIDAGIAQVEPLG